MLYLSYKCIIPVLLMGFYKPLSSRRETVDMGDEANTAKKLKIKFQEKG